MIYQLGVRLARRWRFAAVFIIAALGMTLLGVGTATAAPSHTAAVASTASRSDFTAQALRAGLTRTQAATLQTRVDSYLAQLGGTQVAANEIRLAHGADLLLVLPGEKTAHSLTATPSSATPAAGSKTAAPNAIAPFAGSQCWVANPSACCSYHYICGWSGEYGTGDVVTAYYCGSDVEVPNSFTTYGSWINNETAGVRAYFKNASHKVVYTTPGALSSNAAYNWHPVWYIDAC